MVHGNPTWSFYFRNLAKSLSDGWRVIIPDHIGCGLSDKPPPDRYPYTLARRVEDLTELLFRLGVNQRITLVLHDWGGMIGMAYAVNHVKAVSRIVILNTAAFFPAGNKPLPLRLWLIKNLHTFSRLTVLGLNVFARGALYMAAKKPLPKKVKKGLIAPYYNPAARIATLKFVQDIPWKKEDPAYPVVKHVENNLYRLQNVPMILLWGMRDFVFDAHYLKQWQKRFPGAKVHRFYKAGHYVLEDEPAKISLIVKDFLKRHPI
jgi:haloalkane dehalogenase